MSDLFFPLSKVFWVLVRPENWLFLLMLGAFLALLLRRPSWGLGLLGVALTFYTAVSVVRPAPLLLSQLEETYPPLPALSAPAAIVVLGGGEDAEQTALTGLPSINERGDRFVNAIALAHRFPEAKLVFTGGTGWFREGLMTGADVAGQIFTGAGIAPDRLILEGRSLNTWQNATNTLPLMADLPAGEVVLVTSAFHLPRAVEVFCAAGWRGLVPYPTDFHRSAPGRQWGWRYPKNIGELSQAVKERIGLLAYRRTGRALPPRDVPGCLWDQDRRT